MTNKLCKPLLIDTIKATEKIEAHRFISFRGSFCNGNPKAYGVSEIDAEIGELIPVAISGVLLVEAGGTITVGDPVSAESKGRAIKAPDGANINGYALDSGVFGDIIRIVRGI